MISNLRKILKTGHTVYQEEGFRSFFFKSIRHVYRRYFRRKIIPYVWKLEYGVDIECARHAAQQWEKYPLIDDLLRNISEEDIFYDIGAHVGEYTGVAASILPPNQVVAFEPGAGAADTKSFLKKQNLQVEVIEKAVSQTTNGNNLYYQCSTGGKIGTLARSPSEITPATISGEEIVESELPLPTVVSVDVRGAELDVIKSIQPLLARDECRLVYCEVHTPLGRESYDTVDHHRQHWSFDELLTILSECGFDVEIMYVRGGKDMFIKGKAN